MKIKTIKKDINHEKIIANGYKLVKLIKGHLRIKNKNTITIVLVYKKPRFCENIAVGYYIKYFNRFGLICTHQT